MRRPGSVSVLAVLAGLSGLLAFFGGLAQLGFGSQFGGINEIILSKV